jgi:outer membrane murein-binding lipoprotein Lpp
VKKEGLFMFDRCIECERLGQDCVPNLLALSWSDLLNWWKKRQTFLGWSNQVLSDKSTIPLGTINRIKSGEDDCRYSTMRCIIHALMGSYAVEFPCQKKLDQEFANIETLETKCKELSTANEGFAAREQAIRDEAQRKIDFLVEQVKHLREESNNLWDENNRKAKMIDMFLQGNFMLVEKKPENT